MADLTQSSQHSDKPKQYIQGWVEFYKLKFKVTPDVLIPRPESELLVDEVIKFYTLYPIPHTLIDIGTGSGNLAISIAKNLPKAKIFATDISEDALNVARENARKNKVTKRIFFLQSDLLSSFSHPELDSGSNTKIPKQVEYAPLHGQNDNLVIVTNLPYIPRARISYLDPSVRDFEPIIALDGGSDGFDLYRKLFEQIRHKFLQDSIGVYPAHTGGVVDRHGRNNLKLIVCEIDHTHGEIAAQEAQKYFPKAQVEIKTDLAKNIRILKILF